MSFWFASGLGFCLSHIEVDTEALLHSAGKDRIDMLARMFAPNEARARLDFASLLRARRGREA